MPPLDAAIDTCGDDWRNFIQVNSEVRFETCDSSATLFDNLMEPVDPAADGPETDAAGNPVAPSTCY